MSLEANIEQFQLALAWISKDSKPNPLRHREELQKIMDRLKSLSGSHKQQLFAELLDPKNQKKYDILGLTESADRRAIIQLLVTNSLEDSVKETHLKELLSSQDKLSRQKVIDNINNVTLDDVMLRIEGELQKKNINTLKEKELAEYKAVLSALNHYNPQVFIEASTKKKPLAYLQTHPDIILAEVLENNKTASSGVVDALIRSSEGRLVPIFATADKTGTVEKDSIPRHMLATQLIEQKIGKHFKKPLVSMDVAELRSYAKDAIAFLIQYESNVSGVSLEESKKNLLSDNKKNVDLTTLLNGDENSISKPDLREVLPELFTYIFKRAAKSKNIPTTLSLYLKKDISLIDDLTATDTKKLDDLQGFFYGAQICQNPSEPSELFKGLSKLDERVFLYGCQLLNTTANNDGDYSRVLDSVGYTQAVLRSGFEVDLGKGSSRENYHSEKIIDMLANPSTHVLASFVSLSESPDGASVINQSSASVKNMFYPSIVKAFNQTSLSTLENCFKKPGSSLDTLKNFIDNLEMPSNFKESISDKIQHFQKTATLNQLDKALSQKAAADNWLLFLDEEDPDLHSEIRAAQKAMIKEGKSPNEQDKYLIEQYQKNLKPTTTATKTNLSSNKPSKRIG